MKDYIRKIVIAIPYIFISLLICLGVFLDFAKDQVVEIDLAATTPPFYYPLTEPVFMQYENIILSYEYIDDGRHLVAVDNDGVQYIMPLFPDKETALDFMDRYFIYLREVEK